MVEKISNLEQISQFLQDGNICSDRVKLYLELAKVSPGRLVLLKNSKQYVTLYKELGRKAASPSLLIEHYFFYQANNKDFKKIIPTSEVQDILDFIYHHYDDFWLSYDNLLPNQHDCDDEIHRYNLLQLQGLTYESYLSQLNSNSRFNLKKALNRTADAETIHITGYDQLSHYIKTFIKDHYYLKYGEESLLRNDLILSETLIAAKLFNTHLYVIQAESRYAFILFAKIDGSLYVLF
ncbi:MAG: hypothetical protein JNN15_06080, partial [Blastocatellia bacterium]|nr:hypothetical protein [Blastocatellia bacterium]